MAHAALLVAASFAAGALAGVLFAHRFPAARGAIARLATAAVRAVAPALATPSILADAPPPPVSTFARPPPRFGASQAAAAAPALAAFKPSAAAAAEGAAAGGVGAQNAKRD